MVLPDSNRQTVAYIFKEYQDVIADRRLGVHPEICYERI